MLALGAGLLLAACDPNAKLFDASAKKAEQGGFRGTGMAQIRSEDALEYLKSVNTIPAPPYEVASQDGPKATEVYENIQVLTDLSADEFNRLMLSITEWIVPADYRENPDSAGGCAYCHNPANMASDEVYQKGVARKMLQMTRTINTGWTSHVQATGVTCWTCHRGQAIPAAVWAMPEPDNLRGNTIGNQMGQNRPIEAVAYSTLPSDPFTPYLWGDQNIRVIGTQALKNSDSKASIRETEQTTGLMMHMSDALGVNCAYCHNTRSFGSWSTSTPQRVTAWHGIRMVREINNNYIEVLADVFPASRKGPLGDVLKVNCTTCHQGVYKPLQGVSMIPDYPELARVGYAEPAPMADQAFHTPVAAAVSELGIEWLGVDLTDRIATLVGTAPTKEAKDTALTAAEAAIKAVPDVPANLIVVDAIGVEGGAAGVGAAIAELSNGASLASCQKAFVDTMAGRFIGFDSGRATITGDSARLLDALSGVAVLCSAYKVEIGGHTDTRGNDGANPRLSEQRAQAVLAYLTGKGVPADRLAAVGYGEAKPLDPADNTAAHERNRRIEFVVSD